MRPIRPDGQAETLQAQAEAKSAMAVHLHDSVLQTLALVQREAGDPNRVTTLARRQEQELRTWLYGQTVDGPETLARALERTAGELEDMYRVPVEVVAAGDTDLDRSAEALLAAGREAIVNALKHSGTPAWMSSSRPIAASSGSSSEIVVLASTRRMSLPIGPGYEIRSKVAWPRSGARRRFEVVTRERSWSWRCPVDQNCSMIRVFVVDDHDLFRVGIRHGLSVRRSRSSEKPPRWERRWS